MNAIETLAQSELFGGLSDEERRAVAVLARSRHVAAGQTIFRDGDPAEDLYVVRHGRVELTFPLIVLGETKETRFQSLEPGRTLAWSALVPPHRLTMGARATTDAELLAFGRDPMLGLFAERPAIGYAVMSRLSRVVASRMQELAALWRREIQRNVSQTYR
jgi:CRP-like cAMP-binding protein